MPPKTKPQAAAEQDFKGTYFEVYDRIEKAVFDKCYADRKAGLEFLDSEGYRMHPRAAIDLLNTTNQTVIVRPRLANSSGDYSSEFMLISSNPYTRELNIEKASEEFSREMKKTVGDQSYGTSPDAVGGIHMSHLSNIRLLKNRQLTPLTPEERGKLASEAINEENAKKAEGAKPAVQEEPKPAVQEEPKPVEDPELMGNLNINAEVAPNNGPVLQNVPQNAPQQPAQAPENIDPMEFADRLHAFSESLADLPNTSQVKSEVMQADLRMVNAISYGVSKDVMLETMNLQATRIKEAVAGVQGNPALTDRLAPIGDFADGTINSIKEYREQQAESQRKTDLENNAKAAANESAKKKFDVKSQRRVEGRFTRQINGMVRKSVTDETQLINEANAMDGAIAGDPKAAEISKSLRNYTSELRANRQALKGTGNAKDLNSLLETNMQNLHEQCEKYLQTNPEAANSKAFSNVSNILRYADTRLEQSRTAAAERKLQEQASAGKPKLNEAESRAVENLNKSAREACNNIRGNMAQANAGNFESMRRQIATLMAVKQAHRIISENPGELDPATLENMTSEATLKATVDAIMDRPNTLARVINEAGANGLKELINSENPLESPALESMTNSYRTIPQGNTLKDSMVKMGSEIAADNNKLAQDFVNRRGTFDVNQAQFKFDLYGRAEMIMDKVGKMDAGEMQNHMMQNPQDVQTLIMARMVGSTAEGTLGMGHVDAAVKQLSNAGYPACLEAVANSPVYQNAMKSPEALKNLLTNPEPQMQLKMDVIKEAPKVEAKVQAEIAPKPVAPVI